MGRLIKEWTKELKNEKIRVDFKEMNLGILIKFYLSKTYSMFFNFFADIIKKLLLLTEFFLFLRLILKFLDANPKTFVVSLIYQYSDIFLSPFQSIFPDIYWPRGYSIEVTTIAAMIGYALVVFVIVQILRFFYRD